MSAVASRIYPSATEDNYLKLKERYDLDLAAGVARDYLDAAIAQPRGTVVTHWSISCLPSTGGGGRLFTVNVGALEGAYLWVLRERSVLTGYFVTVFVDRATLEHDCRYSVAELDHRFGDDVLLKVAEHTKFAGRAVSLTTEVLGPRIDLPEGLRWKAAAASLAAQLMDESTCAYAQYHNRWLAERVLNG
ncbi:hypothetical protein ACWEQV_20975 [Rhodococcus aetherivorans]